MKNKDELTIALAGNPNAGKSTIFNALTGMRQHTGNWPGKTVELKTGTRTVADIRVNFVDLPGTYSLAALSPDEVVAQDFLVSGNIDAIICVVDAANLERNLYLVVQLLELGLPVVVALNMVDQAQGEGIQIDSVKLSQLLGGSPVVPTIARRGKGIDRLLQETICHVCQGCDAGPSRCNCTIQDAFRVSYGNEIEEAIQRIMTAAEDHQVGFNGFCPRWAAIRLLEGEATITERVNAFPGGSAVTETAALLRTNGQFEDDVDIVTADYRYTTVSEISKQVSRKPVSQKPNLTSRVDSIATSRAVGLPVFMLVMYVVFRLVIDVSEPFLDWVDALINGLIANLLSTLLINLGAAPWLHSLVIEGILAGVGGILVFVPGLALLFFFLALLEDSGYMARAAFVMDRFMRVIGLHGKSVIPLILGFGCAVPAIYATRTIASRRDRLLTALLVPFMSCSARLPVYLIFAMALFGARAGTAIWLLYLLGAFVAVLLGLLFSRTLLKPDNEPTFLLELPAYHMPTLKSLALHTWANTREFMQKAGTIILAISILLWFLLNLPWGVENQRASFFGQVSGAVAPALGPAGFGDWDSAGALVTGFIAKEMVVSTLAQVYAPTAEGSEGPIANMDGATPPESSIADELLAAAAGLGQAFVDSGKALVSIVPGINLSGLSEDGVVDTGLTRALQVRFTPLAAASFLVFVLLYTPCVATVSAIRQEFGGWWAAGSVLYQTAIAWVASVLVFQIGTWVGLG